MLNVPSPTTIEFLKKDSEIETLKSFFNAVLNNTALNDELIVLGSVQSEGIMLVMRDLDLENDWIMFLESTQNSELNQSIINKILKNCIGYITRLNELLTLDSNSLQYVQALRRLTADISNGINNNIASRIVQNTSRVITNRSILSSITENIRCYFMGAISLFYSRISRIGSIQHPTGEASELRSARTSVLENAQPESSEPSTRSRSYSCTVVPESNSSQNNNTIHGFNTGDDDNLDISKLNGSKKTRPAGFGGTNPRMDSFDSYNSRRMARQPPRR